MTRKKLFSSSDTLCQTCYISENVFGLFFWLGYFNSCLNPFIYACTSNQFKRAFQRILCRKKWRQKRALSYTNSYRTTSIWSKTVSSNSPNVVVNILTSPIHVTSEIQTNQSPGSVKSSPSSRRGTGRFCQQSLGHCDNTVQIEDHPLDFSSSITNSYDGGEDRSSKRSSEAMIVVDTDTIWTN